jgi:hypothetical protein
VLWSDSACPTTGQTRLFKHRSNCRVQPVNAGSVQLEIEKKKSVTKEKLDGEMDNFLTNLPFTTLGALVETHVDSKTGIPKCSLYQPERS